ncbi:tubulin--tyrosine ligase [Dimargaris xerosporica]|nr:tubulin--tyrosine ligase [Dimargaris xerosporica]
MTKLAQPTVVLGLDEPYVRDILTAAFHARPEAWTVHQLPRTAADSSTDALKALDPSPDTAGPLIHWLEYEAIDWDRVYQPTAEAPWPLYANAYCIRKGLIRKAQMAYNVHKYVAKHPQSVLTCAVPSTYILELDHLDYLDEAMDDIYEVDQALAANACLDPTQAHYIRFIMKPSLTGRGAGIHIFDSRAQLEAIIGTYFDDPDNDSDAESEPGQRLAEPDSLALQACRGSQIREWVIQTYIDTPLLLKDCRKFHIRVYVLAVGAIEVFLWEDMLCLFAAKPYSNNDLHDNRVHLTNTCLQANDADFDEAQAVYSFWELANDSTPCNIRGEQRALTRADLTSLFSQIKVVLSDLFDAVTSEVTTFQARNNCFELFGFDFMVDSRLGIHLLEANAFPDFKQTGKQFRGIVEGLFEATVDVLAHRAGAAQPANPLPPAKLHSVYRRDLMRSC